MSSQNPLRHLLVTQATKLPTIPARPSIRVSLAMAGFSLLAHLCAKTGVARCSDRCLSIACQFPRTADAAPYANTGSGAGVLQRCDSIEPPCHQISSSCKPTLSVSLLFPEKLLHIASLFWARFLLTEFKHCSARDANPKRKSDCWVLHCGQHYARCLWQTIHQLELVLRRSEPQQGCMQACGEALCG